jgi:cyclophilin family peptidyl-prolyl cis-trans isomerase
MKIKFLSLFILGFLSIQAQTPSISNSKEGLFATISTNKGDIELVLEYEKSPVTVANFVSLAEGKNNFVTDEKLKGKPFYDGLKFHRVISNFMIQTGDPLGIGSGGTGYAFKDEFNDFKFDKAGVLAMANSGPATNSSQFFITHKDTQWLDDKHTIFGRVIAGMDVVNKILQGDVITKVTITRKGSDAKKFNAEKVFTNYFNNKEEDAKKEAAKKAEAEKAEAAKYESVIATKLAYLKTVKETATTTASGLVYNIVQKGTGIKPADGTTFYFHYAGYFEDGNLFDSSYESVNKLFGKYNPQRAAQNGYNAFPFQAGRKEGMIPGFLEGLSYMSYGDKAVLFIPANLAYGEKGAGGVIPPNATLIFELEMFESQPTSNQ